MRPLTAAQKQQIVWSKISAQAYAKLPEMVFFPPDRWLAHAKRGVAFASAAASLGKSFDHASDEMPEGRVKVIHAYGSSVRIAFIPKTEHPFTGLFKSGAIGVARLSLATPMVDTGTFVPGMAIKLFVDGQPSKNMHIMQRLEGQGDNRDFFKHTFTNKLPQPETKTTQYGAKYFARFVEDPIFLTVNHVAAYQADGTKEAVVKAPYQLFLRPAGVHLPESAADFREELTKIPEGSALYEVYGTYSANTTTPIHIGTIVTTSQFIASEYSDKTLYFQHEGAVRRTFWTGSRIK